MARSSHPHAHQGLGLFLLANAAAAAGGALSLIVGAIDLGATITARLPWSSPVVGGCALACIVAVPLALAGSAARRGEPETADLVAGAGVLLVGWILVQVAVIRSFSWFQPAYALTGLGLATVGSRIDARAEGRSIAPRWHAVPVAMARNLVITLGLFARRRVHGGRATTGAADVLPDGRRCRVFRITTRAAQSGGDDTDLVRLAVWFRLRGVPPGARRRRWLFEHACVVNTLLFAGASGFLTKRWAVAPDTNDWAGFYTWEDAERADLYGRYITAILRPLSTPASVGYAVEHDRSDPPTTTPPDRPGPAVDLRRRPAV